MDIRFIFNIMQAFITIRLFNKNYPLAVRWQLTDRCNNFCRYCALYKNPRPEMAFEEIKRVLDELKENGVVRVSYSGGEPLLREDISGIIEYTKDIGISCSMNTRGALIDRNKDAIINLDLIKISLDGTEETHDRISHRSGAYNDVIYAIERCREWGVNTVINTTITNENLNDIEHLLSVAEKYKIMASFQPVKIMYKGVKDDEGFLPEKGVFREKIRKLIELKKSGYKYLRNSLPSLEYILNYPEYNDSECIAGRVFSIIDVDGTLLPCDRNDTEIKEKLFNVKDGFKEAFKGLPDINCSGCGFLGARELNYFMKLNFSGIKHIKKIIK